MARKAIEVARITKDCIFPNMQGLLKEWQNRLELNDWVIDLRENSSPNDFINKGCAGECEWDLVHKTAVIRIVTDNDYGCRIVPFDKEKTLVHELLHIKFAFLWGSENTLQDIIVHQLIEDMAKALVSAKRRCL